MIRAMFEGRCSMAGPKKATKRDLPSNSPSKIKGGARIKQ
jgi:hypothetical protein